MVSQLNLFDGLTYSEEFDSERLTGQLKRVFTVMKDGEWRTLSDIEVFTGGSTAGISARLRDLRKEKFGTFKVERRRRGEPKSGLFEYRLVLQ